MLELIKKWFELKFHVHDWETVEEKLKKVFENDYQSRPVKVEKVYIQLLCKEIEGFESHMVHYYLGSQKSPHSINLKNY